MHRYDPDFGAAARIGFDKDQPVWSKNSISLKTRDIVRSVSKAAMRRYEVISSRCNVMLRPGQGAVGPMPPSSLDFIQIGFFDHTRKLAVFTTGTSGAQPKRISLVAVPTLGQLCQFGAPRERLRQPVAAWIPRTPPMLPSKRGTNIRIAGILCRPQSEPNWIYGRHRE